MTQITPTIGTQHQTRKQLASIHNKQTFHTTFVSEAGIFINFHRNSNVKAKKDHRSHRKANMGRYSSVQAYADSNSNMRSVSYEQATGSSEVKKGAVKAEKVSNPYGSTAGAGSGEYKKSKRKLLVVP